MPLNLPDFLRAPIQQNQYELNQPTNPLEALENFVPNAFKAYNAPIEMKNERELEKHNIEAKRIANSFLEREKEAEIAHKDAMAKYYLGEGKGTGVSGGSGALSNLGKIMQERQQAVSQYGETSPEVKAYDAYINKIQGQGRGGLPSPVITKQTNALIATPMRLYLDENAQMPTKYLGPKGNVALGKDILEYNRTKDPERKSILANELANAALAEKMVAEASMAQITSQGLNPTVGAMKHQEKSIRQNWPLASKLATNNLPKDVAKLANEKHSKILGDLTNLRTKSFGDAEKGVSPEFQSIQQAQQGQYNQQADEYGWTPQDYEATAAQYGQDPEDVRQYVRGGR